MSLHFFAYGEDKEKEESINNYKDLFIQYVDNPPSIKESLRQIFISGGVSDNEVEEYINHMIKKVNKFLNEKERVSKIKDKYPNITHEDSVIITTYTCEALNSEYSPYKILNRNLANDNREEGLKKVSKYLYVLLNSLRKLKRFNVSEEQKYLYRGIKFKIETKIDPNRPKLVPYIRNNQKTFWAFTSTSWLTSKAFDFLGDNGYHEDKKLKAGTFFSLYGKFIGYDISLFNTYNEEEILLEPERKFRVENVIPDYFNDIINVTCEILDSPLVLNDLNNIPNPNKICKSINSKKILMQKQFDIPFENEEKFTIYGVAMKKQKQIDLDISYIFYRIIDQLKIYAFKYKIIDTTPQTKNDLINSLENNIKLLHSKNNEYLDKYGKLPSSIDVDIRNIRNFVFKLNNKVKDIKMKIIIRNFYDFLNEFDVF